MSNSANNSATPHERIIKYGCTFTVHDFQIAAEMRSIKGNITKNDTLMSSVSLARHVDICQEIYHLFYWT